jgi:soluble lytic murein transglycosylase-like protein
MDHKYVEPRPSRGGRAVWIKTFAPAMALLISFMAVDEGFASTSAADTVITAKVKVLGRTTGASVRRAARAEWSPQEVPAVEIEIVPPDAARAAAFARLYRISETLALEIVQSAVAEGVDPDLAFRLVRVEGVFNPKARGPSGGLGLTQLMPSTARAIDPKLRSEEQILHTRTNLRTGFRYLRSMLDMYDGNVRLALLAYNRGETAVNRALRAGRDPENGYSGKVLRASGTTYEGPGFASRR